MSIHTRWFLAFGAHIHLSEFIRDAANLVCAATSKAKFNDIDLQKIFINHQISALYNHVAPFPPEKHTEGK
jgi:hypothetical protein